MAIANELIIFLCILAAGFVVLIGFAIIRHFPRGESSNDGFLQEAGQGQSSYMREVRLRNQDQLAATYGRRYH